MKNYCLIHLLLVTFFLLSSKGFSQNDSILPNLSAVYTVKRMAIDGNLNFVYSSETYSFIDQNINDDTMDVIYGGLTIGTIYSDNQKVYLKKSPTNLFYNYRYDFGDDYELLYDFSLAIDDTAYLVCESCWPAVVDSIDFVTIQGELRKRFFLSNNDIWIQGIGSLSHPLMSKISVFENASFLCEGIFEYYGGSPIDTLSYQNSDGICLVGIDEKFDTESFEIYPNPNNGEFQLIVPETCSIQHLQIFDIRGENIVFESITNDGNEMRISIKNTATGIYILKANCSDNTTLVSRILIK